MSLITIGASRAQTVAISGIAFAVFKNCPWTVMLAIARVTHVAMCRAAAWAVQCLQIFARTGQGQSAAVNDPRPGHRSRSWAQARVHRALSWCWWWHWDLIVSRSPGYQSRCPWRGLCTFQLYPRSSQTPAPWRVACALAWPELVNVRELGQWQRAKWNDITQVAEYFINPAAPAHRPLSETKLFYWTWIFFSFLIISN